MSAVTIHLIVRAIADGVYARSPQCPGLSIGRGSIEELRDDLDDALSFYFDRPGPFDVLFHEETPWEFGADEVVVRRAMDAFHPERTAVAERVVAALRDAGQRVDLLSYPADRLDEHLFVAVVPTDSIGWTAAQLDDAGDPAVLAAAVGEGLIWTTVVSYGDETGTKIPGPQEIVAELPEVRDTTVADLMLAAPLLPTSGRHIVHR